jgi:hypothetical protein
VTCALVRLLGVAPQGGVSPGFPAALPPLEPTLDDDSAPSSPCHGRSQADVEMGGADGAAAQAAGTTTGQWQMVPVYLLW